ncbi:uncharacterized protein LACBIDRAFT_297893 [Laccaria bicolor S238N-H82]|uniref:Predicted protein n=1 Tax=Laccaria bicolor (strain S238N-H82 / ATCC MYA-4686) TaxID=486041 RepID=B0DB53_LACBS|nr:uncharacterized protein LACBIDRAFT_297893 [Laccaria bicolor S238N-H82]EDR08140.1 predicted protein [Laccaria bicolor S238N-H82]|eukprot:XP_001881210.1 predicted protein [Laccaria bicolor S238N-H82]
MWLPSSTSRSIPLTQLWLLKFMGHYFVDVYINRHLQSMAALPAQAMVPCLEPILKRIKNQKLHILCTINYVILKGGLAQRKDLIKTDNVLQGLWFNCCRHGTMAPAHTSICL